MLVDEHCEAITADLARYYQRRVTDLFTGGMTYFELAALLAHLPMESAYRTAVRDSFTDEELAEMSEQATDRAHGPWTREALLLAASFDALRQLSHIQVARAGVQQDPPQPLPRPGVVDKRPKLGPQTVAYLDAIRRRHAEDQAKGGAT
jgi:hypothetical protein